MGVVEALLLTALVDRLSGGEYDLIGLDPRFVTPTPYPYTLKAIES